MHVRHHARSLSLQRTAPEEAVISVIRSGQSHMPDPQREASAAFPHILRVSQTHIVM